MIVKYMDKGWAIKANAYAKKKGWKHTIKDEELYRLRDNKILPISFMVPVDDIKLTVHLTVDANLETGEAINKQLDIPLQLWEKLPSVEEDQLPPEPEDDQDPPEEGLSEGAKAFLFS
jgi:hypothetical protein